MRAMGRAGRMSILILGGGVAGLWTAARLARAGRRVVLVERSCLGDGQTVASQGIIHGGVKYALGGTVGDATRAIAAMPALWRACLAGGPDAPLDLQSVRVLAERQHLWTGPGLASRFAGLAAGALVRSGLEKIRPEDRPEGLRAAPREVGVYAVPEPVLEPRSLVESLAAEAIRHGAALVRAEVVGLRADGRAVCASIESVGRRTELRADAAVLLAGAGNEPLLAMLGLAGAEGAAMQRRPLHMVLARETAAGVLPKLWAHAIGTSSSPRITVTSQRDSSGRTVWYLGGALSESGVERESRAQVQAARAELREVAGWIDWSAVEWATVRVDRAEGRTSSGRRPDGPTVSAPAPRVIVGWPSKLALAPVLAQEVERMLPDGPASDVVGDLSGWARPDAAPLPWERGDLEWQ